MTKMRLASDPRWSARGMLAVAALLVLSDLFVIGMLALIVRWK